MEDPPAPSELLRKIMYHVSGAAPQLRPYSSDGPTLYALTVFGARPGTAGAATLAGPAVDPGGLEGWPAGAAGLARAAFAQPGRRPQQAGAVTVFVTLQAGRVSHCVPIGFAGARAPPRPRAERRPPVGAGLEPPATPGG